MVKMNPCRFNFRRSPLWCAIAAIALFTSLATQSQVALSQPAKVTIAPQFSPNPLQLEGVGGGDVAATAIAGTSDTQTGPCSGFVSSTPNHVLKLTKFFNALNLQVESNEDTALIIKGPGGVWCNDDFDGNNPGISGQWQAGDYSIWVSSYKKNNAPGYTLRVVEER
ncbi:hypothetical protein ACN4EK_16535 [Pantanalinema rosaneae CENA516]|uniref:hypothetical protein n=1 Tax=Pantanalinema rosaneae TaxID=1620701 RepID=UPI003D6FA964